MINSFCSTNGRNSGIRSCVLSTIGPDCEQDKSEVLILKRFDNQYLIFVGEVIVNAK